MSSIGGAPPGSSPGGSASVPLAASRLHYKKIVIDNWTIKEKFVLAVIVSNSEGDTNWVSVSRQMRQQEQFIDSFGELKRPPDWYNQKNCAQQYSMLLDSVQKETPKRKRDSSRGSSGAPAQEDLPESMLIVRNMHNEYIKELQQRLKIYMPMLQQYQEEKDDLEDEHVGKERLDEIERNLDEEDEEERLQKEQLEAQRVEREKKKLEVETALKVGVPSNKKLLSPGPAAPSSASVLASPIAGEADPKQKEQATAVATKRASDDSPVKREPTRPDNNSAHTSDTATQSELAQLAAGATSAASGPNTAADPETDAEKTAGDDTTPGNESKGSCVDLKTEGGSAEKEVDDQGKLPVDKQMHRAAEQVKTEPSDSSSRSELEAERSEVEEETSTCDNVDDKPAAAGTSKETGSVAEEEPAPRSEAKTASKDGGPLAEGEAVAGSNGSNNALASSGGTAATGSNRRSGRISQSGGTRATRSSVKKEETGDVDAAAASDLPPPAAVSRVKNRDRTTSERSDDSSLGQSAAPEDGPVTIGLTPTTRSSRGTRSSKREGSSEVEMAQPDAAPPENKRLIRLRGSESGDAALAGGSNRGRRGSGTTSPRSSSPPPATDESTVDAGEATDATNAPAAAAASTPEAGGSSNPVGRRLRRRSGLSTRTSTSTAPADSGPNSPAVAEDSSRTVHNVQFPNDMDKHLLKLDQKIWTQHAHRMLNNIREQQHAHRYHPDAIDSQPECALREVSLFSIKQSVDATMMKNIFDFQRDITLMILNVTMSHHSESEKFRTALQMWRDISRIIGEFRNAIFALNTPAASSPAIAPRTSRRSAAAAAAAEFKSLKRPASESVEATTPTNLSAKKRKR